MTLFPEIAIATNRGVVPLEDQAAYSVEIIRTGQMSLEP